MKNQSISENMKKILKDFNIDESQFLGKGGEGFIYAYGNDKVIKIYKYPTVYLHSLMEFQDLLSRQNFSFKTPRIREIGKKYGIDYTIEDRLFGISMQEKFPAVSSEEKYIMLRSYYEALRQLHSVQLSHLPYGTILQTELAITDDSWQ